MRKIKEPESPDFSPSPEQEPDSPDFTPATPPSTPEKKFKKSNSPPGAPKKIKLSKSVSSLEEHKFRPITRSMTASKRHRKRGLDLFS